jgi:hypothetical protein
MYQLINLFKLFVQLGRRGRLVGEIGRLQRKKINLSITEIVKKRTLRGCKFWRWPLARTTFLKIDFCLKWRFRTFFFETTFWVSFFDRNDVLCFLFETFDNVCLGESLWIKHDNRVWPRKYLLQRISKLNNPNLKMQGYFCRS